MRDSTVSDILLLAVLLVAGWIGSVDFAHQQVERLTRSVTGPRIHLLSNR